MHVYAQHAQMLRTEPGWYMHMHMGARDAARALATAASQGRQVTCVTGDHWEGHSAGSAAASRPIAAARLLSIPVLYRE